MAEHGVGFCPTLAATDATAQYAGWRKGVDPEPPQVGAKRAMFQRALQSGVAICMGGDVGVYTHGDNVRERCSWPNTAWIPSRCCTRPPEATRTSWTFPTAGA